MWSCRFGGRPKLEILEETIAYYSEDPNRRSISEDGDGCYYLHPENGNRCAVGRCLTRPLVDNLEVSRKILDGPRQS